MPEVWPRPEVFERGSAVLAYWVSHAEGLTVEPLGAVVERVLVPAPFEQPDALVVRFPSGRTRTIAADRIVAVDPGRDALLLTTRRRERAVARASRWAAPRALRALQVVAVATWTVTVLIVDAARWLAPRAWTAMVRGTRTTIAWTKPKVAALYRRYKPVGMTWPASELRGAEPRTRESQLWMRPSATERTDPSAHAASLTGYREDSDRRTARSARSR